jgi:hypothetical protein
MYHYIIYNLGCKCFYRWPFPQNILEALIKTSEYKAISNLKFTRTGLYIGPALINNKLNHVNNGIAYINTESDTVTVSIDSRQFRSYLCSPGINNKIIKKLKPF